MRAGSWKSTDAPRMGAINPLSSLIRGASSGPIVVFGGQPLVSMNIALIDGITYICASLRHECPKTWTDVTEIIGALGSHVLFGKPPTNHPQGWWLEVLCHVKILQSSFRPSHPTIATQVCTWGSPINPDLKLVFSKLLGTKKTCATSREMVESWDPNSKTHRKKSTTDHVSVELMSNDVLLILFSQNSLGLLGNVLSLYEIQIWTSSLVTYHLRHLGKSPIGTLQWSNVASWKSIQSIHL